MQTLFRLYLYDRKPLGAEGVKRVPNSKGAFLFFPSFGKSEQEEESIMRVGHEIRRADGIKKTKKQSSWGAPRQPSFLLLPSILLDIFYFHSREKVFRKKYISIENVKSFSKAYLPTLLRRNEGSVIIAYSTYFWFLKVADLIPVSQVCGFVKMKIRPERAENKLKFSACTRHSIRPFCLCFPNTHLAHTLSARAPTGNAHNAEANMRDQKMGIRFVSVFKWI